MTRIKDDGAALALAERLNGNDRRRPIVVVSTPAGRAEPWIDVAAVSAEVSAFAEVVVITTGPHTWTFSRAMPQMTQVYGGAGRVYPVGTAWVNDLHESPLRFAYNSREGEAATDHLIADAERMAARAGLFERSVMATPPVLFTGRVIGFPHAERAIVKEGHTLATVIPEHAAPGVPLERVMVEGMEVTGLLDRTSHRLDLRGSRVVPELATASYEPCSVILTRVVSVRRNLAELELFPGVAVRVMRDVVTSNDLDSLIDLLSIGETVPARVVSAGPDWQLSLIDVDDDEVPLPAASVFPGGPPWLVATPDPTPEPEVGPAPDLVLATELDLDSIEVEVSAASAPPPVPAAPPAPSPLLLDRNRPRPAVSPPPAAPTAPPQPRQEKGAVRDLSLTVSALKSRVDKQASEIADLINERNQITHELRETQLQTRRHDADVAKLRAQLRKAAKHSHPKRVLPAFADRERGFRLAVELAWASRTPVAEQASRPLADYTFGPDFLDSLERLEGVNPAKVADVVFEILTDRVKDLAGRDVHQLRESESGGAAYVRRSSDGAHCFRAALQVNAPSARRIHYWVLPGGGFELSRVGVHDDLEP